MFGFCYVDFILLCLKIDSGMPSFQPFLCKKLVDMGTQERLIIWCHG